MGNELKMTVSGIVPKDGRPNIYVVFEEGTRKAEGSVPDCIIMSHNGFSDEEVRMLERYMKEQQDAIRALAKDINPIKAMMK